MKQRLRKYLPKGIEENDQRQKPWLEIENISGKSVLAVQQDFFAKIVALNLKSMTIAVSQALVDEQVASRAPLSDQFR